MRGLVGSRRAVFALVVALVVCVGAELFLLNSLADPNGCPVDQGGFCHLQRELFGPLQAIVLPIALGLLTWRTVLRDQLRSAAGATSSSSAG